MLINKKREWKIILDLVKDWFDGITTDQDKEDFKTMWEQRFSVGYVVNENTVDEIQTSVSMMMEFVYNNDIETRPQT